MSAELTEWRKRQKRLHVCRECGTVDAYTLAGRTVCADCAEKQAKSKRDWREDHPEANALAAKRHRDLLFAQGRCTRCGREKPQDGRKTCKRCRVMTGAANRRRRQKQGVNWPRGGNGICWQCNREPVSKGYRLCESCLAKAPEENSTNLKEPLRELKNKQKKIARFRYLFILP